MTTTRENAKVTIYRIPIRRIVANTNPRNPLSKELQKLGYTVFHDASSNGQPSKKKKSNKSLWDLAVHATADCRAEFAKLMEQHDPEFVAWAQTFMSQGQLQAVEVRDNGKTASGESTYTLVDGCRRCLAVMYNWIMTGKPKEPVINATLEKGSNSSLLQRAFIYNSAKRHTLIEDAKFIKQCINLGETREEVAQNLGLSIQTIDNRLKLCDLEPAVIQKINGGEMTVTQALNPSNGDKPKFQMRPRKEILAAAEEFIEGSAERAVFDWLLCRTEKIK